MVRPRPQILPIAEEPEDPSSLACMINSEVVAVLAVMRLNVRWSGCYADDHLIHSLKSLRRLLFSPCRPSPADYLRPFLDVIRSDETDAPITGVALSAVYKIFCLDVLALDSDDAIHSLVDAVTSCRFEVTDSSSEEAVLTKILQVLLACMRSRASAALSNQHVCTIFNTCFRIADLAGNKRELLQQISRHILHELIRCIFSHMPDVAGVIELPTAKPEMSAADKDQGFGVKQLENGDDNVAASEGRNGVRVMVEPYGIPCMVEIFHFLCSLLNIGTSPHFALGLINSAIELGGSSIGKHPELLSLVQDELFRNLIQFGLSMSPLILSMVCSIVLNLYHHLCTELKLQIEAFFSCVILRLAQGRDGETYQLQEVAMEALVDFCRQRTFMAEMYANLDCDITCSNLFENLANLLSEIAVPVNSPLSVMHVLALDGLIAMIQVTADRISSAPPVSERASLAFEDYTLFWTVKCENYSDPDHWVKYVRRRKYFKRRLLIAVDYFNRDPEKGLEILQRTHLLPEKLDPQSVACFFRYTDGLDKNLVGDFLGNHDEFCVQVLHEFAGTFDFEQMNLDTALRLFLETFWLPGVSQKIQRVLEAFSGRYYEQSPHILPNEDAVLLLSYSLILLSTHQHNVQEKRKMTEEDFIRNTRCINGGNDLPVEFLLELYCSICRNEIKTIPDQGLPDQGLPDQGLAFLEMTPNRWIDLMRKSKKTSPYIVLDSRPFLGHDLFAIMSGPTISAISAVFDCAEHEEVFITCIDGFLAIAKISAYHHLEDVLDDLVLSLCKFTTLMNTSLVEEPVTAFGDDRKAQMATETVFNIANRYGDYIRTGWRNILDCILRLHKLGLLPARVATDAANDSESASIAIHGKPTPSSVSTSHIPAIGTPRRSSGLMGRFSQQLSLDTEEPRSQPAEQQLTAHQRTLQTIQKCHIDGIFTESKFLQAESLFQLARSLIWAAGRPQKVTNSPDDEDTAVFCLELLIAITLNNLDRIVFLWQGVYDHIANIVQSTVMPCALVEKAVFGLLRICQRLLPYKEDLVDHLLKSLQLVLKLDARVADAYCEKITQEVTRLVKANATRIKSQIGWRTITSLLSITTRHQEASEVGFEALVFIMSEGHLSPANFVPCIEATRQFAESRVGLTDRSVHALDLMAGSMTCLSRWSHETEEASEEAEKISEGIREMWLRLVQALRKMSLDQREEVRNYALSSLQKCLVGIEGICLSPSSWLQSFDLVIFTLLDDLLEITQSRSQKDYRNMEGTLLNAMKLLSKVFLQLLQELSGLSSFCKLWLGVLSFIEKYMKVRVRGKMSEKLHELILELLKNTLHAMKSKGILAKRCTIGGDSLWELTWLHVNNISSSLQSEVFPDQEVEQEVQLNQNDLSSPVEPDGSGTLTASEANGAGG